MVKKLILERRLKKAREVLDALEEKAAGFTYTSLPVELKINLAKKRQEVADLESRLAALGREAAIKQRRWADARRWFLEALKHMGKAVVLLQIGLGMVAFVLLTVAIVVGNREPSNLDLLSTANNIGDIAYYFALVVTGSEVLVFALMRKWLWLVPFFLVGGGVFALSYFMVGGIPVYLVEICIPLVGSLMLLVMTLRKPRLNRQTVTQP